MIKFDFFLNTRTIGTTGYRYQYSSTKPNYVNSNRCCYLLHVRYFYWIVCRYGIQLLSQEAHKMIDL